MKLARNMVLLFPCTECSTKGHLTVTVQNFGGQTLRVTVDCENCGGENVVKQDLSETIPGTCSWFEKLQQFQKYIIVMLV